MQLMQQKSLPEFELPEIQIERTKNKAHGDFACNIALILAKRFKMNPREFATKLIENLPTSDWVEKVDIAGPGFINFKLTPTSFEQSVPTILTAGEAYGRSIVGHGKRIHLEYVSAIQRDPCTWAMAAVRLTRLVWRTY